MDLIAEMVFEQLKTRFEGQVEPMLIRPTMRRRLSRFNPRSRSLLNADRAIARILDYPIALRSIRADFDLFHIIDHSYAHLVHYLPAERTIVTCHDLDTFRCILMPSPEPRSEIFCAFTRRILRGLQRAARVVCVSHSTRDQLLHYGLIADRRITVIYNGVAPEFCTEHDETAEVEAIRLLGPVDPSQIELLHVGSTIWRKRIDVLLRTFAGVRKKWPQCRLIQAGGALTDEQWRLVDEFDLREAVVVVPELGRKILAAIYQRATLLMMTSDAEGFGLPVLESMACDTPVLASRIAALIEVGGSAAEYATVGDVDGWIALVDRLLTERRVDPDRWADRGKAGILRAAEFSWNNAVNRLVQLYYSVVADTVENPAYR